MNYVPTKRCTIEQALKNAELEGIEVHRNKENTCAFLHRSSDTALFVDLKDGWVRSGHGYSSDYSHYSATYAGDPLHAIESVLTSITNCDWVDENQDEYELYSLWTDEERLTDAECMRR